MRAAELVLLCGLPGHSKTGWLLFPVVQLLTLQSAAEAGMVDPILRGANPAEMLVEQPFKYELVLNLGIPSRPPGPVTIAAQQ
jgi:hypothetical protein